MVVGVALLIAAVVFRQREVLFVAFLLIAIPVVAIVYVMLRGARVHVTRSFAPGIVPAGGEVVVSLVVRNIEIGRAHV